jgi:hypothetical protein
VSPVLRARELQGSFKVVDSTGQTLAYVYGHATSRQGAGSR